MRTNIEIDDLLMKQAMKASGAKTKKAAVEEALQMFVRIKGQGEIRKLFGKVKWEGDRDWSGSKDKWAESEQREREAKSSSRNRTTAA
ncbi:type II toxin-antitoxin system VapB family antitoxin [Granulicella paludicola]|uniref:type II toxin-antitoxin system VapB family antitoxin n=1 Tax=Granulicella paludicola TaxID=474951 RepID=UPI0021E06A61|nr:type II toxin-antitoxin system VapB family antitoxin [Granulicella paludicola]